MNAQYRVVPFELTSLDETKDRTGWEFSGYCSTFGNVDQGGDVVMRGAFDTSLLARKKRPLLWQHDLREPIGVEVTLKPDDKGLFGTWKVVDTARGTDAHKLLKSGAIDSMSIGYVPTEVEFDDVGTRLLKSVDLLECSVVSLPMNEQALVTQVKAEWDAAFINDLPDSAFAVILPGGSKDESGRTTPRSLRKLPHHGKAGDIDAPHLRNALSREPQASMPDEAHGTARRHLQRHAKAEGIGQAAKGLLDLITLDEDEPFEDVLAQVKGFVIVARDAAEALAARRADDGRQLADGHRQAIEDLLSEVKASAARLERLLVLSPEQAEADAGDLKFRLELHRRLRSFRARG